MQEKYANLGQSILDTENDPKSDIACKLVLAYKPVLARILKPIVPEYRSLRYQEIEALIEGNIRQSDWNEEETQTARRIIGDTQETDYVGISKTIFDLRFHAALPEGGDALEIIVNVEAQQDAHSLGYRVESRMVEYESEMIVDQKGKDYSHSEYNKIRKVYSIWIITDPTLPFGGLRFPIVPQIAFGSPRAPEGYDLMEGCLLYIGKEPGEEQEYLSPDDESWEEFKECAGMLQVLFSENLSGTEKNEILRDRFKMEISEDYGENVKMMSDYIHQVGERVMQKVTQEVTQKVKQEGLEVMKRLRAGESPQKISKELNWDVEEVNEYADMLNLNPRKTN